MKRPHQRKMSAAHRKEQWKKLNKIQEEETIEGTLHKKRWRKNVRLQKGKTAADLPHKEEKRRKSHPREEATTTGIRRKEEAKTGAIHRQGAMRENNHQGNNRQGNIRQRNRKRNDRSPEAEREGPPPIKGLHLKDLLPLRKRRPPLPKKWPRNFSRSLQLSNLSQIHQIWRLW